MKAQKIKLGAREYTVRPQKVGYLIHHLGPDLQSALTADIDVENPGEVLGVKARDVLAVFIPDLMPGYEFVGFSSQEAMDAGEYDPDGDRSPEPLQVEHAFKVASDVNGGQVFSHLKGLIGPKLWESARAFMAAKLTEEGGPLSKISTSSQTSPSTNGDSGSTSSTTTPPTPTTRASEA
jgi:hypothetical protein